jgi:hypothetical protein
MASGARAQRRTKASAPPSPSRWLTAWISPIRAPSPRSSGPDQHLGQRLARQQLLLAPLQRPKAGHQPRLGREGGEQALGEGVDGLDPEAAAGGVEHPGEEPAGAGAGLGAEILPERLELGGEIDVLQPNPISQPAMDPIRHLGRARLGEGEAQDRGRIGAVQQQPEHPRGEDVGLAGAGRGGERRMIARRGGGELLRFESGEGGAGGGTLAFLV